MDLEGLRIDPDGEGCRIGLRVKPGGRGDRISGIYGERLRVEVSAAPEKGRANESVRALLARTFGVPRQSVELVAGEASRDKSVRVALAPEEARERLAAL